MRRALGPALAVLVAVTLTTGPAVAAPETSTVPASAPAPERVSVTIDAKRNVVMPATTTPGRHVLAISTARADGAMLQVVVPRAGYTRARFVADMNAGFNDGRPQALVRLEQNVDFLGGAWAARGRNGTAVVELPDAGKVWVLDTYPYTFTVARVRTVTISGTRASEASVDGDATLTARPGRSWDPEPRTLPTTGTVVLDNASDEPVGVDLYRLKPGRTIEDFDRWVRDEKSGIDPGPMPIDGKTRTFVSGVSPGHRAAVRYSLPPGDYVVFSEWRAAEDGNFQFFHGLYRAISVVAAG